MLKMLHYLINNIYNNNNNTLKGCFSFNQL